jgi:hypothetical protein
MVRSKAPSKKPKSGFDFKVLTVLSGFPLRLLYSCFLQLIIFFSFFSFAQKIKRRVGRKLPPPKNATDTAIKSKGRYVLNFLI